MAAASTTRSLLDSWVRRLWPRDRRGTWRRARRRGLLVTANRALLGVLANDFDTDAGTTSFTASVATPPSQGQLTAFAPDGSFDYVPDPDFSGTDTFTYSVSDGLLEQTATVSLDVTPINDAPLPGC